MKHLIRDTLIFLISIFGISYAYRKYLAKKGPLVRIVVFHDVTDKDWFESMVETLVQNFHIISPQDFYNKKFHEKKINILVTFDDGYQSWVDVALPVLKKNKCKALFFISSGLLDVQGNEEKEREFFKNNFLLSQPRKAISWSGANQLVEAGHTLGGHARNHENLTELMPDDLERVIREDKKIIENKLNIKLSDFAYPFGRREHFNEKVVGVVKGTGYSRAFTAISGFVQYETFTIPRMCIESKTSKQTLKRWIFGGYDIFTRLKV